MVQLGNTVKTRSSCFLTDLGIVSALGLGAEETYARMMAGDTSGLRPVQANPSGETTCFGFAPEAAVSKEAVSAAGTRIGALLDAVMLQLAPALDKLRADIPASRIGIVVGTSNSTMEEFTDNPDHIDMAYPSERLQSRLGVKGPAWTVSTACSSSAKVFGSARRLLADDICDAVIVGGADAFTRTVIGGFGGLEALAAGPTHPLAVDRGGLSLGEGAALFVMKREHDGESGVALLGVGESSDAWHITSPDPEGRGAEAAMRAALADASLAPSDIDYVNLHGTGTTYNDDMECAAVCRLFGSCVPCSSTKAMTGHCLGAAGALEAALCYLAMRKGVGVPPHAVSSVDTALAPFPVPFPGNSVSARTVLSNSFAFGGSNASLVLGLRKE